MFNYQCVSDSTEQEEMKLHFLSPKPTFNTVKYQPLFSSSFLPPLINFPFNLFHSGFCPHLSAWWAPSSAKSRDLLSAHPPPPTPLTGLLRWSLLLPWNAFFSWNLEYCNAHSLSIPTPLSADSLSSLTSGLGSASSLATLPLLTVSRPFLWLSVTVKSWWVQLCLFNPDLSLNSRLPTWFFCPEV